MEKYLKIGDYFGGDLSVSSGTRERIVSAKGEVVATTPSPQVARLAVHAINSHNELVAMNKELLEALEGLLSDMRLRAKLDGDVDSDGCVVLNCGNGVLYAANQAIAKAKGTS